MAITMIDAIKNVLVSEMQTALASFYPAGASANEYIYERFEEGDPPAMTGQWYCAIHKIDGRNEVRISGQPYVNERWSACITITVRSAYAADSRIQDPMLLGKQLMRTASARIMNRDYEIMALINTVFAADNPLTNGLTEPFIVQDPMPVRQTRDPAWLKAISRKATLQKSAFSGTIHLVNALQRQVKGDIA